MSFLYLEFHGLARYASLFPITANLTTWYEHTSGIRLSIKPWMHSSKPEVTGGLNNRRWGYIQRFVSSRLHFDDLDQTLHGYSGMFLIIVGSADHHSLAKLRLRVGHGEKLPSICSAVLKHEVRGAWVRSGSNVSGWLDVEQVVRRCSIFSGSLGYNLSAQAVYCIWILHAKRCSMCGLDAIARL
jgi:hypothetical protein